eukprot:TRINITY_DN3843_c0_g1_i5.p1 TRINITY_DN3843_c0_g1~~TRINITY_DN3843_c0_g1_i5.p1  ORF type:complete len:469 (-),score=77.83 TRINITY_DN3843_c0_g1_i5:384-1790(-)
MCKKYSILEGDPDRKRKCVYQAESEANFRMGKFFGILLNTGIIKHVTTNSKNLLVDEEQSPSQNYRRTQTTLYDMESGKTIASAIGTTFCDWHLLQDVVLVNDGPIHAAHTYKFSSYRWDGLMKITSDPIVIGAERVIAIDRTYQTALYLPDVDGDYCWINLTTGKILNMIPKSLFKITDPFTWKDRIAMWRHLLLRYDGSTSQYLLINLETSSITWTLPSTHSQMAIFGDRIALETPPPSKIEIHEISRKISRKISWPESSRDQTFTMRMDGYKLVVLSASGISIFDVETGDLMFRMEMPGELFQFPKICDIGSRIPIVIARAFILILDFSEEWNNHRTTIDCVVIKDQVPMIVTWPIAKLMRNIRDVVGSVPKCQCVDHTNWGSDRIFQFVADPNEMGDFHPTSFPRDHQLRQSPDLMQPSVFVKRITTRTQGHLVDMTMEDWNLIPQPKNKKKKSLLSKIKKLYK